MRRLFITALCVPLLYAMPLQKAIVEALQKSPTLQAKKLATHLQKEQRAQAKAKMYGTIDLNGAYTHYNIPRTLKPLTPPITPGITTSQDITTLGASYEVAIFKGFADLAQVQVAQLATKKSAIDYKLSENQLIYNIKALYFKGLGLQKSLAALRSHQKALQTLAQTVQKEVQLGKKAPLDLLKVQSRLTSLESKIVATQNAIASIKAHLGALIGTPFDTFEPATQEPMHFNATPYLIQSLQMEIRKSEKELKKAKALFLPKIFFKADYAKNFAKGEDAEVWQTSVALGYTLFDFGVRKHTLQKAKIASLIAQKRLAAQKLDLSSHIKETKLECDTIQKTIASLRTNLELLTKIEEIEKIKYESGRSEIDDYLTAIANAKEAQSSLAQKRYELYTKYAYLNYLKAGE